MDKPKVWVTQGKFSFFQVCNHYANLSSIASFAFKVLVMGTQVISGMLYIVYLSIKNA